MVIDPRRHGALADGCTLATVALQSAIDAAAAVRGTVLLGAGSYLSGALFLRSGVTLQLEAGATLRGSRDLSDYPDIHTRVSGIWMRWPAALLNVIDAEDVAVIGEGTIDGDGAVHWAAYWALRAAYEPRGLRWASDYDARRPRLLLVQGSRRVHIGGSRAGPLRLRRAGFWTLHLCHSQQLRVDRVQIRNNDDGRGPSTDGIDIDSCERVLVRRADIAVNDDAIAFKAGRDADGLRVGQPVRDVLVADCTVHEGATGIAFGSETSGGFERVRVRRLRVAAVVPVGVLVKSSRRRGGWLRDVQLHDLRCDGVAVPLRITLDWNPAFSQAVLPAAEAANAPMHWRLLTEPVPPLQGLLQVKGLRITRLVAHGASTAFEVDADERSPIVGLQFEHCDIEADAGGHLLDVQGCRFVACQLRWSLPLLLHDATAVRGLPASPWREDPSHPRRDVAALPMQQQDVS